MLLRPFGQTGLQVSPIGLGTVIFGRDRGVKYARPVAIPDDDRCLQILAVAHQRNINLIDTAPAYGPAEDRLGYLLPQVAPRDFWTLCTKVGEEFNPLAASGRGASFYDFTREGIFASVERSLLRLNTDRLDLVSLHFATAVLEQAEILRRGEAIDALRALQSQGKLIAVGASVSTPEAALLAIRLCDAVMIEYHPGAKPAGELISAAAAAGTGVLVKRPLASGHFQTLELTPEMGFRFGEDPATASLRWVMAHPGVGCAVVGTSNPAHLARAADVADSMFGRATPTVATPPFNPPPAPVDGPDPSAPPTSPSIS